MEGVKRIVNLVKSMKDFKKNKDLFLISLPAVVFIFIFCYLPIGGIIIAFKNYRYDLGIWGSEWVGLENFKFLYTDIITRVIRNTIGMNAIFIVTGTAVSVTFALMLFELGKRAVKVYHTVMFFPFFLSWVVVGFLFMGFFDMDRGLINNILKIFGQQPVAWYNEPSYWPAILTLVNIWKGSGYSAIIYYAVLTGIDNELFEAAILDGASRLQQVRHISLPMLVPMLTILTLLSIGRIFYADFGMFFFLTKDTGLLYPTTDVMDTYVFRSLRVLGDTGMSAAAGLFQSIVGFILVLASNYAVKKFKSENSLF